jgi:hypothetical protein
MTETNLTNTIAENAAGPARARGDSTEFQQHSLPDQIAADKYLASKSAIGTGKKLGIKFLRIKAGGAI